MRFKSVFNHLFIHVCSMHIHNYISTLNMFYITKLKKFFVILMVFAVDLSLLREKK